MPREYNQGYIAKKKKGSGAYEDFYLEGVELLQELSGKKWTDYNEHDPGVTILENIAYTLTDLSNKTKLPIEDLLTESKGSALKSGDNGFFIPSEILTTNPVTIDDFRKLLIDGITNVKNVWIHGLGYRKKSKTENLKGLYRVYVEMYRYDSNKVARKKEEDRIRGRVREIFHQHRNLCEDIYSVHIFKPFLLNCDLNLSLDENVTGEDTYAQVFFVINDYLSHEVQFSSLWELEEAGEDMNEIFNGPSLENGFVKDSELTDRIMEIDPSDIIRLISKVPGVVSVDRFDLQYKDENQDHENFIPIEKKTIKVPTNSTPRLLFPKNNDKLIFRHRGVAFHPDLNQVQKILAYIQAMNLGSFKSVSQAINQMDIPQGENVNASEYYPLRNQFPLIYGVGEFGLATGLPQSRYAQAQQLKAFLLPFDQLMGNFLSQLTNIYTLYDVSSDELHSYFYQNLKDMPNLLELISSHQSNKVDKRTLNAVIADWDTKLGVLRERYDLKAIERLNDLADSLLARFGEKFPTYALRKIDQLSFGKSSSANHFDSKLLSWKRELVRNYGELSYNRAKAYDYKQMVNTVDGVIEDPDNKLIPGIIKKISVLLGIEDCSVRRLADFVENSGINIYRKSEGMQLMSEKLEFNSTDEDAGIAAVEDVVIIDDKVENLRDDFYYIGNSKTIFEDVLKHGSNIENYELRQTERTTDNQYYVLLRRGNGKLSVIHVNNTKGAAQSAINYAFNFIGNLCSRSEGMYLIEHILLVPPYHSDSFGYTFSIPLEGRSVEFEQFELKSNGDRNEEVHRILDNMIGEGQYQFRTTTIDMKFVIQIFTKAGVQVAVTTERFPSKEEANEVIDQLVKQLHTFKPGELHSSVQYFAYYNDGNKVNEQFFSHQMSFVLPSWPVRFQSRNFRSRFNMMVTDQAPAHLAFNTHWIDVDQMHDFETIYYDWIRLVTNNHMAKEQKEMAYKIYEKLQFYNQTEPLNTVR